MGEEEDELSEFQVCSRVGLEYSGHAAKPSLMTCGNDKFVTVHLPADLADQLEQLTQAKFALGHQAI